jgi:antibiotic biosynthesis monooxygenase (ABM) superfamily enzyme
MVLYVTRWDINPDKLEAYMEWTQSAIKRALAIPGVVEFRAYRPAVGKSQIVATYEFADLGAWAAWQADEDMQKVIQELYTLANNVSSELWGPSPVVPEPIRPGG